MEKFLTAAVIAGLPLILAAAAPVGGMLVAASILALLSFGMFTVAKGGIHEVASAVLLVGAFMCVGFSSLIRSAKEVRPAADAQASQAPPTKPRKEPTVEVPPRNIAEPRERAFDTPLQDWGRRITQRKGLS